MTQQAPSPAEGAQRMRKAADVGGSGLGDSVHERMDFMSKMLYDMGKWLLAYR